LCFGDISMFAEREIGLNIGPDGTSARLSWLYVSDGHDEPLVVVTIYQGTCPSVVSPNASTTAENEVTVTTALTATAEPLTLLDRCDRCGAQAYVRVTMATGGELIFCAHHGREYSPTLRSMDAVILDETERLDESREVVAG